MAYTLRIKEIKEETLVADNTQFLDVEVEILEEGKVIETRKFGYPLTATEEEITADLHKTLELYGKEKEAAILDEEQEKLREEAQETINNLKDLEINDTSAKPKKANRKK